MLRFLNVGRWVYNRALDHRIKAYRRRGESVQYGQQQKMITGWRDRMEWIRLVPVEIERDALRRVDRGMKAFFRRVKAGDKQKGFPRFKARDRWRSFEVLQTGMSCTNQPRDRLTTRMPFTAPTNGCIPRVDTGTAPEKRPVTRSIGIDVGLTHFATLSDGTKVENPRWYRSAQHRLRFLQRIVSRRRKGSNRRRRAVQRVAVFHERIADTRKDWIHQLTRRLVNEFDLIAIEKLNVKGLARTRLAKSILDAAWSQFATNLSLKAENAGVTVVAVDPRNTSQECSKCGRAVPKLLSDRVHSCGCGYVADRDENAARNILLRVPEEITRGECTSAGPVARSAGRRGTLNREAIGVTTQ